MSETSELQTRLRRSTLVTSLVAGVGILALKFWGAELTGSAALQSDALESIVNVIAALFALGAEFYASQPADSEHPYGHGKVEFFSAAFEGGLISLAAALIFYSSIEGLIRGTELRSLDAGILIGGFAGLLNGLLGGYLIRRGRKYRSAIIEADGHHVFSDFLTTVGVLIGLIFVKLTGWGWIDPVIALVMSLVLARTGFKLIQQSSGALLDATDDAMIDRIVTAVNHAREPELIAIHALKAIRTGRYTHVDLHVVVPEFMSVRESHDLLDRFEKKIITSAEIEGELHSHSDPCWRRYCARCSLSNCTIRASEFQGAKPITREEAVRVDPES